MPQKTTNNQTSKQQTDGALPVWGKCLPLQPSTQDCSSLEQVTWGDSLCTRSWNLQAETIELPPVMMTTSRPLYIYKHSTVNIAHQGLAQHLRLHAARALTKCPLLGCRQVSSRSRSRSTWLSPDLRFSKSLIMTNVYPNVTPGLHKTWLLSNWQPWLGLKQDSRTIHFQFCITRLEKNPIIYTVWTILIEIYVRTSHYLWFLFSKWSDINKQYKIGQYYTIWPQQSIIIKQYHSLYVVLHSINCCVNPLHSKDKFS